MTEEKYEEIAKELNKIYIDMRFGNRVLSMVKVVNVLAKTFAEDNPRFDAKGFNKRIFG